MMQGDSDLEAIRAKRLAELEVNKKKKPLSQASGVGSSAPHEDEEKKAHMEDMRRNMLFRVLSNEARERLARIAMVKPEKARGVEDLIVRMAQSRQLQGKVDENQLISLLAQISSAEEKKAKIVISRRRDFDESDDEYDL